MSAAAHDGGAEIMMEVIMSQMLQKSKWTVEQWLEAIARNEMPAGHFVDVVRVAPGEIVKVHVSGTGNAGYCAQSWVAGKMPEVIKMYYESLAFGSDSYADLRFTPPSIVYTTSSDLIGNGRVFGRTVYVCI